MESVASRDRNGRAGERGFALVVAILALMLLTFLGLTLAATSSTELQIAANHRWSQQAYYNAEAGLELGKRVLMTANWPGVLWQARTVPGASLGNPDLTPLGTRRPDLYGNPVRDLESRDCDPVANAGYGVVLDDGTAGAPYQNVSTWPDANVAAPCNAGAPDCLTLNGSFTVWVRYRLQPDTNGLFTEDGETLVLTSEGTAPYANSVNAADPNAARAAAFVRANRAVQVLEVAVRRFTPSRCAKDEAQVGSDAAGSGMTACEETPDKLALQGQVAPGGGALGTGNAYDDRR